MIHQQTFLHLGFFENNTTATFKNTAPKKWSFYSSLGAKYKLILKN